MSHASRLGLRQDIVHRLLPGAALGGIKCVVGRTGFLGCCGGWAAGKSCVGVRFCSGCHTTAELGVPRRPRSVWATAELGVPLRRPAGGRVVCKRRLRPWPRSGWRAVERRVHVARGSATQAAVSPRLAPACGPIVGYQPRVPAHLGILGLEELALCSGSSSDDGLAQERAEVRLEGAGKAQRVLQRDTGALGGAQQLPIEQNKRVLAAENVVEDAVKRWGPRKGWCVWGQVTGVGRRPGWESGTTQGQETDGKSASRVSAHLY